jgi:phage gp45-like
MNRVIALICIFVLFAAACGTTLVLPYPSGDGGGGGNTAGNPAPDDPDGDDPVPTAIVVHVRPDGAPRAPGTADRPVDSLAAARDLVRTKRRAGGDRGATIVIHDGVYELDASLVLTAADGGGAGEPVVYRAAPGATPVISGGVTIDFADCQRVTEASDRNRLHASMRTRVRWIDLRKAGVTGDVGLQARGMMHPVRPGPPTPVQDGRALSLACWPNDGYATIADVIEAGSAPRKNEKPDRIPVFRYEGDRPKRWADEPNGWMYGYWFFDWADESLPIGAINANERTIALAKPHWYSVKKGMNYRAENILAELDAPGEYYLDPRRMRLYYAPVAGAERKGVTVSRLDTPIIDVRDASHIVFRGLTIAHGRGDAVRITGGREVRVEDCELTLLGNRGVDIDGGEQHAVAGCHIHETGEGGISVGGGDRNTLTPAGHEVVDCRIHDYNRRVKTYRPGVSIDGVGQRIAHNEIFDAPHSAIIYSGNDHLIELNDIHHVLSETGDGGAIYTGRDWTYRGTVIRHNLFRDIRGIGKWENVVYIDDLAGGVLIEGNVFVRCHWAMLLGGGRDMTVRGNIFVDCDAVVRLGDRGLGWAKGHYGALKQKLEALPYKSRVWREKYPRLVTILEDEPMTPKGNAFLCNIVWRSQQIQDGILATPMKYTTLENNAHVRTDPGFVNAAKDDFRLRSDAPVLRQLPCFEPIPIDRVGPRTR